ncbi:hypothetical protein ABZ691_33035 [Streptomyces sp. NPDC006854]|uniref:hypothetical protein n=1 Tax=Streptomyces sp. NPDC006854 TaxID=3155115 RepID=UPI0033C9E31F
MTADVSDLLASIDDVLADAKPTPAPAVPVAPVPSPAPSPEEGVAAVAAAPFRVGVAPRLPYWWQNSPQEKGEPTRVEPADTADTAVSAPEEACGHERVVLLHPEGSKEVLGRRCLECDEGVPEAAPEPQECEHPERLEARTESGKLVGYVCAEKGCGARLTKDEVHGRIGKWLRPAESYYPRPRNPLSPTADGQPPKRAVSAATLRLLANAGAAGAGYVLGLAPMFGTWIEECGRTTSIGGALFLGGSMCLAIGHFWDRRTRHWYPGLAWAARIPLASAITALALYAPASQI